jgi:hypothetical protein
MAPPGEVLDPLLLADPVGAADPVAATDLRWATSSRIVRIIASTSNSMILVVSLMIADGPAAFELRFESLDCVIVY